jgi:hypothetical protein
LIDLPAVTPVGLRSRIRQRKAISDGHVSNEKQFPLGRSRTKSKFGWTMISTNAN